MDINDAVMVMLNERIYQPGANGKYNLVTRPGEANKTAVVKKATLPNMRDRNLHSLQYATSIRPKNPTIR